jgi:hypothetical protein
MVRRCHIWIIRREFKFLRFSSAKPVGEIFNSLSAERLEEALK